jgi:hypothetical protein
VTGVLPFEKKTDYEYMTAHLHEQPLPPTSLQPAMPKELEDIILKAIDKDPDKRFQSAHELRRALLKVGMTHVRAYRRLKTLRKEKDKAALSAPQTYRRGDEPDDGSLLETIQDKFEQLRENKAVLAAVAGTVAAIGIATAVLLFLPAAPVIAPEPVAAIEATAPGVAVAAPGETELPPGAPVGPIVATETPAPATAAPTVPAQPEPAVAIKSAARKPVTKTRAPKQPDKYDTLKKAWGG